LKLALGEIAEVNALQSRLEATTLMTDYLQSEAEYQNMLSDLTVFEGGTAAIDSLSGALSLAIRTYQLQALIELAQDNRSDLQAAIRGRELSAANVRLAKANRVIDLGLNIGFAHNTIVLNEIAPAPRHNSVSAGLSIPLKLSNTNRGQLRAAQYAERQAEAEYDAVLLQIRKEVEQCYNSYVSACRQAELYQNRTLSDATQILEKKKYSYARGETSLLEVLDAQRTANEVYQNYYEALYNANASLVELCRAVGIWDVEF
jgi:cobalt-zinc-cadmium efflux system outer membrane protein